MRPTVWADFPALSSLGTRYTVRVGRTDGGEGEVVLEVVTATGLPATGTAHLDGAGAVDVGETLAGLGHAAFLERK